MTTPGYADTAYDALTSFVAGSIRTMAPPVATAAGPSSRSARASPRDGRDGGRQPGADQHRGSPPGGLPGVDEPERVPRLLDESAAGRLAIVGVLGHRPREHVVDRRRQRRPPLGRARRRLLEMGVDDGDVGRRPRTAASRSATRRAGSRARRRRRGRRRGRRRICSGRDVVDRAHQVPVGRVGCPRRSA